MRELLQNPEVVRLLSLGKDGLLFAIWETCYVTVIATFFAYVIGLPLGVLMVAGEEGASAARTEACDEPGKPLVVRYVCTEEVEREEDGTLRLAPFGAVFPGDNPFGQTTVRHFPVDIVFRPVDVYRVRIAIPQGYRVKSLPSGMKVEDGISRFTYEAVAGENEVVIEAEFSLSESRYPASAYALLRKRYDGMLDALSRPVVFEPEELLP